MQEIEVLPLDWPAPENVHAGVTSRNSGFSLPPYKSFNTGYHVGDSINAVKRNRNSLRQRYPQQFRWQWVEQVHSNSVVRLAAEADSLIGDGLVTSCTNLVCCIQTADCLPVFFSSKSGKEIAIAHAGWRGLADGILENIVAELHSPAEELMAYLGPAIAKCHFEVGVDVREYFLQRERDEALKVEIGEFFSPQSGTGKSMADLYGLAKWRLERLGLNEIYGGENCTYCNDEEYFSYRREGICGRMTSFIVIEG